MSGASFLRAPSWVTLTGLLNVPRMWLFRRGRRGASALTFTRFTLATHYAYATTSAQRIDKGRKSVFVSEDVRFLINAWGISEYQTRKRTNVAHGWAM